jgi:hypothetical protein
MTYPFDVSLFDAGYIIVTLSMPSIEGAAPEHHTKTPRSGDDGLKWRAKEKKHQGGGNSKWPTA